jgi:Na+/H+-dicarboxylate symporter
MKKLSLTHWIFIALLLGVAAGAILNFQFPASPAPSHEASLQSLEQVLSKSAQSTEWKKEVTNLLSDSSASAELKYRKISERLSKESAQKPLIEEVKKSMTREAKMNSTLEKILEFLSIFTEVFLRLIKMIIAPLVFATLVAGVAKLGDLKAVGRIGGKTLLWFMTASLLSLFLGAVLVNWFQPGHLLQLEMPDALSSVGLEHTAITLKGFITHIFPASIMEAMSKNEILQIVIFALLFGVACASMGEKANGLIKAMDALGHVMLKITSMVMYVAPFAVFSAITAIIAKKGVGILATYATFIGEFYLGLLLLWLLLIFVGWLLLGNKVKQLLSHIKQPLLLAFSTASSEAAYPKMLEELERFGCRNRIVSFVLPLGYSFNLDGSMMYMTFASLFIAQAYGVELSFGDQVVMLLTLMITSKGIAGVPRASLVVIAGTIASFGIPEAGLVLLLGVDHVLDMGRSATNVVGNAVAAVAINKWEE